jgi:hypothetical protein
MYVSALIIRFCVTVIVLGLVLPMGKVLGKGSIGIPPEIHKHKKETEP